MKQLLIAFLLIICWTACENDKEAVEALERQFKEAVETTKEVEVLYSQKASVRVRLKAPLMLRHKTENPYMEFPNGISLDFFDDSLQTNSLLTANYAIRREKDQITTVRNKVVWQNKVKNEQLETEELIWNERTHKISSDKFVKITTDTESIMGEGFESNQDFSRYRIKKITGTFKVKPGEFE